MQFRTVVLVLALSMCVSASAEPVNKPAPTTVAPEALPHGTALFLCNLSGDGQQKVTFKAQAVGTRFFFEETTGVTVYIYAGGGYKKETFLKGLTLQQAVKKYEKSTERAAK